MFSQAPMQTDLVNNEVGVRSQAPIVVRATNLSKRYGSFTALESLNLEIRPGEVFALLGPNGSGKTTFLRLIAGYLVPSSGSLAIGDLDAVKDRLRARARIGYVPESAPLYGEMRVLEFLTFMARLRGVEESQVEGAVHRVVDQLALGSVIHKLTRTLSRGYRQRTALAQALVHDPQLLLLDEPTNGLDPRQIIEIRSIIQGLKGRHTVVMSSHILSEVARTAERVAILLGGKLLGVRAISETPDLEAWFLSLT
jgi:ABC-2 type transport system ATP-binding protein